MADYSDINILDGDIDITGDTLNLVKNTAKLSQQEVETALSTFKGEWFANTLDGVPYFQELLTNKKIDKRIIDSALKLFISNIRSVARIKTFKSIVNISTRTYILYFDYVDIYGEVISITYDLNRVLR